MQTRRLPFIFLAAAVGLATTLAAAPPPGKGNGGGGGNACPSRGVDVANDGFVEGSSSGLFLYEGIIENPGAGTKFGVRIDAGPSGPGAILAAVASRGPGAVDLFEIQHETAAFSKVATVALPGLEDPTLTSPSAQLIDANDDGALDLLATHGATQQGWIFYGPGFSDATGSFVTLAPNADAADFGGGKDGAAVLYGGILYVPAALADTGGGPRGAVFACDLGDLPGQTNVSCVRQSTPKEQSPTEESYDVFGRGMTLANDGGPKLLVSAAGAGKGRNKQPDRIFVYGHNGSGFDFSGAERTLTPGERLAAFDYTGSTAASEVFSLRFHGPGYEFLDARGSATELPFDPDLQFQYATTISAGALDETTQVLLVNGPGEPESCNGNVNDGYVYLYIFDTLTQQDGPSAWETLQSPTSDGADFGWDVAATGTTLVLIGERGGAGDKGRVYLYRYVGPETPPQN